MTHPNEYAFRGTVLPVIDLFFLIQVAEPAIPKLAPEEVDLLEWAQPSQTHLENMAFHSNRLAVEFWMSQA